MEIERTYKLKTALRYWYEGKGYFNALQALALAEKFHTGTRKDGVTPEIHHQISIAGYLKTLHDGLLEPESTYVVAWLHDIEEDYEKEYHNHLHLAALSAQETDYSIWVPDNYEGTAINTLNRNEVFGNEDYYFYISNSPTASVVKGADRIHNFQTMHGVFSPEKQVQYVEETEQYIIPMLKEARNNFPEQINVYYNIIHVLRTQIEWIQRLVQDYTSPGRWQE